MIKKNIRNFCIIAHIDHGKSTLADRLLEITGTIQARQMKNQVLDKMDLEREKGITIKLASVQMIYKGFELNLIDTPGHVDFSYEVSRSLAACEGAILVVDATQGIQAQTLANLYLAIENNLTIIPVINKVDLPAANVEKVENELIDLLAINRSKILKISAKTGQGVEDVLGSVITNIPQPEYSQNSLRALIFDSYFDDYRGVVLYIRVFDGQLLANQRIMMLSNKVTGQALEVGVLKPQQFSMKGLSSGEIGYVVTNFHSTQDARVGDTLTLETSINVLPLDGYKEVKPFVYAGFYPVSNEYYNDLKMAIEKLALNDSALRYSLENSPILGFGVRIGFLGLLHLDIVKERLEREYGIDLIVTNPSTDYEIVLKNGLIKHIQSATELPDITAIELIKEPWIKGEIISPKNFVGAIVQLISTNRGQQKNISYIENQALISFEAPLANLLTDFYDDLKTITSGFGSLNYDMAEYRPADLVKVDFYVAQEKIDALSTIVHRQESRQLAQKVVLKLKEIIPRQNFKVSLQAGINSKIIAREDISAFRKDVTTGLYGGDVSRKKKVLAKQKKGKSRMKKFGKVDIPAEAFQILLKRD